MSSLQWTPQWASKKSSPSVPSLMALGVFSVITPRNDYHLGRADKFHLWLAQISTKVGFFKFHVDGGTLTPVQAQFSFRRISRKGIFPPGLKQTLPQLRLAQMP